MIDNVFIQAITLIFKSAWTILTAVKFPGTQIPIAVIIMGAFLVGLSIRIVAISLTMSANLNSLKGSSGKPGKGE